MKFFPQLAMTVLLIFLVVQPVSASCPTELSERYRTNCADCPELFLKGKHAFFKRSATQEDFKNALLNWGPVIKEAEALKDHATLACLYRKASKLAATLEQFTLAIEYSQAYLALPDDYTSLPKKSRQNGNISEYFSHLGFEEEAYRYHLIAIDQAKQSGDPIALMQVLHQSGTVFYYQGKYEEAMDFYRQALNMALKTEETRSIGALYGGMASAARKAGDPTTALAYAFSQYHAASSPQTEAYALQNIGDTYQGLNQLDSSLHYLQMSLSLFEENELDIRATKTLSQIGQVYQEKGELEQAKYYYQAALRDSSYAALPFSLASFQGMASILRESGNYQEATAYLQKSIDLQKRYATVGSDVKKEQIQAEFLLEKTQGDLTQLEQEYEIQQLQSFLWTAGAITLMVLLIAGGFAFQALRRSHWTMKAQKEQIEDQNDRLLEYNERLKRFNSVASHDLKQPLRTTISLLGLFNRRYGKEMPEEAKEYLDLISQQNNQMFQLIEGLLQLSSLEKVSKEKHQKLSSWQLAENALGQLHSLIEEQEVQLHIEPKLDQWPEITGHPAQLTQVWQNLLANAIKFSDKTAKEVSLGYDPDRNGPTFYVKDNGIGIAKEDQEKIFGMFSRLNPRARFEGSGIGLATCKRIVDNHDGQIWVESEPGQGSTFFFRLPAEMAMEDQPTKGIMEAI